MNKLEMTRFPVLDYACKEAINTLCTNLTFAGSDMRKIMITSCQAHEGKSFLALCIQRTLAQLRHSCVLVDLDLRRSQISARYGMKITEGSGHGASHYLAGMCSLKDALYETDVPGAYMIPVGHEVSNSLALLSGQRLGHMLRELQTQFEFVIVDAPPVGVIIDAAEIAKSCDGVIFGIKYNFTTRKDLAEAKAQIARTGCEILGAVLNDVDVESLSAKKYYNKTYFTHYDSDYYKPSARSSKPAAKKGSKK